MLLYIIFFRLRIDHLEKRKNKNFDLWNEKLFPYLDNTLAITELTKLVKKRDIDTFIEFLFGYLEGIKGSDAEKIRHIFREMKLVDRERYFLLKSNKEWRRALAAYRLGQIRARETEEELIQALSDKSDLVSYAASSALMKIGERKSIAKILTILLAKETLSGELFAEIILGYGKGVVSEIAQALTIYFDLPRSRTKIIDFLGYFKRVEIAPFLIKLLETTKSDEEKIHVIKALGNLTAIDSFPALVRCLKSPNPTIKSQAAKALGSFKDESAFPVLSELLEDRDWWCRYHAATAIFKTGVAGEVYLKKLSAKTTDSFARDIIKQVVAVTP